MDCKNPCGIWIGADAVVALVEDFRISFLRLRDDLIASILHHRQLGTLGAIYGHGKFDDAYAVMAIRQPNGGTVCNRDEAAALLDQHAADAVSVDPAAGRLRYSLYDGRQFDLVLADPIDTADFAPANQDDASLSVAEKMALWNQGVFFEHQEQSVVAGIDTKRYSVLFSLTPGPERGAYCRVGQNGYCDKGLAMRSTVCLRPNEARMLADNLSSIGDYHPVQECFVDGGCAFPPDGGWYWSVKEVRDDVIYLNGCGGQTYEIRKS